MCLNALWEIAEGNVEDVRRVCGAKPPSCLYDRSDAPRPAGARGAVSRRKEGRGFAYQPTVARDKLRSMALRQFLEYHFDGSEAKLRYFWSSRSKRRQPRQGLLPWLPRAHSGQTISQRRRSRGFRHGNPFPKKKREDTGSRGELDWRRCDVAGRRCVRS